MTFVQAIDRLWSIVVKVSYTWQQLKGEAYSKPLPDWSFFCYMMLLNAVAAFIGGALNSSDDEWFIRCLLGAIISPLSFYVSVWAVLLLTRSVIIPKYYLNRTETEKPGQLVLLRLIIYTMSLDIMLSSVISLFPSFFFIKIMALYTFYIAWEGIGTMLDLDENSRGNFVVFFTVAIIIMPLLFHLLLKSFVPVAA